MYISNGRERRGWAVVPRTLWAVHSLPHKTKILVDATQLNGVPKQHILAVADSYNSAGEYGNSARLAKINQKLLARFTSESAPGLSANNCPVLRLLRIRWYLRTAALPFLGVQQRDPLSVHDRANGYRAMAAWYCSLGDIQPRIRQLCHRILDGTRLDRTEAQAFYEPKARHWFLLIAASRGFNRGAATLDFRNSTGDDYWDPDLSAGQMGFRADPVWFREGWRQVRGPHGEPVDITQGREHPLAGIGTPERDPETGAPLVEDGSHDGAQGQ